MLPAAVRNVTDVLADVDRVIWDLLDDPPDLPPGFLDKIMRYAECAGQTFLDIVALYPEIEFDQNEEEIWHQVSL